MMEKIQRFGGAMFTPVLLFSFSGIMVALCIIFKNPMLVGSIANEGTTWYSIWSIVEMVLGQSSIRWNYYSLSGYPLG